MLYFYHFRGSITLENYTSRLCTMNVLYHMHCYTVFHNMVSLHRLFLYRYIHIYSWIPVETLILYTFSGYLMYIFTFHHIKYTLDL